MFDSDAALTVGSEVVDLAQTSFMKNEGRSMLELLVPVLRLIERSMLKLAQKMKAWDGASGAIEEAYQYRLSLVIVFHCRFKLAWISIA